MSVSHIKTWTWDEFFAWEGHADGRYEFDGVQPVEMNGVTRNHSLIMHNLHAALRAGLGGTAWRWFGPDVGIATTGRAIRYPDAVVTGAPIAGDSHLVPHPLVVFEVVSRTSGRTDRIIKPREYAGVPTLRRYVIVESTSISTTVLERASGDHPWITSTLAEGDAMVRLPEIGIAFPLAALYEDVAFADATTAD